MVPTVIRYAVIGITLVLLAFAIWFLFSASEVQYGGPVYNATAPDTDLITVEGILNEDRSATSAIGVVRSAIVPHHLVAAEAIARGVRAIASAKPHVVFIISPDHFNQCTKFLCTTYGSYHTFFGDVLIDGTAVTRLLYASDLFATSTLFREEHGVYAVVPFVKRYLPDATIVPIVVSVHKRMTTDDRVQVRAMLESLLQSESGALVVSSDFSHYLPLEEADIRDIESEKMICGEDSNALWALDNPENSDCPICLALAQDIAKETGVHPYAVWHSNSAEILHNVTVEETTSHFTFLYTDAASTPPCALINH